jgi:Caspase domain/Tetratricopeptide repeat
MTRKHVVMALTLCMLALRASAESPRRVALVIGNSAYVAAPHLENPGADAKLIAEALRHAGFTNVDLQIDLSKPKFERALQEFQKRADGAEVALVYFAGHGLEVDGRNWLVPVDATLGDERDLPFQAIDLDVVLGTVAHAKNLSIVVLDACRDNPFTRSIRRTSGTRGMASRGLAAIEVTGTLVVYAQRAGQTASDGVGSDSPFAIALAKRLPEPGVDVRILVSKVRDDVLAMTGGKQEPFSYGSLPGVALELVPGLSVPATSTVDPELAAFNQATILNTMAGWEDYLRTYPQGRYSGVAKRERDALAQQPQQDQTFQAVVARYRSATTKPDLPEEARKFRVQAEDAIKEKQFQYAVDSIEQALRIAPWWPEGHYNRGLLLANLGDLAGAIGEMQQYLALVPDAPDARAVQDKIYVWQRKIQK